MSDLDVYSDDELRAERDFLLGSIADLEAERDAGDVDANDFETLRDGYTARAAAVLRLLDRRRVDAELASTERGEPSATDAMGGRRPVARSGGGHSDGGRSGGVRSGGDPTDGGRSGGVRSGEGREVGQRAVRRSGGWRRPALVVAVLAFAVAAGFGVAGASGQRLPGETGSGSTPASKIQGQLAQAVTYFQNGDVLNAIKTYDKVLLADPANAQALAYRGWLLRLTGVQAKNAQLIDEGLASITQAERVDPSYPDSHFFGGEVYLRDKGDPKDAVTEFETYLADNPPTDMGPEVQGELQAARAALAGTAPVSPSATFAPAGPATSTTAGGTAPPAVTTTVAR